ncbi:MAG: hypothetical protein IJ637_00035, partial [Prevotella sp.]|nr:hypothetical protein [Prevotella sp.]
MTRLLLTAIVTMLAMGARAQLAGDPRCVRFMGMPLEGPADSVRVQLTAAGFTEWGGSEDGEDIYFRGKYYGIRAKLMVSVQPTTDLVGQAYVTIGPYRSKSLLNRNLSYFRIKLAEELGRLSERDGAYYYIDDYGSVKLSVYDNADGSRDIRVLYCATAPFYKDAMSVGLRGAVQEIVTDNPLAENPVERFLENGQRDNPDLVNRRYDRYGYLVHAEMAEQHGFSQVDYQYNEHYLLQRRTLTNSEEGIRYVNDYTYTEDGEILTEDQKVYDKTGLCIMSLNMRNNYLTRDEG